MGDKVRWRDASELHKEIARLRASNAELLAALEAVARIWDDMISRGLIGPEGGHNSYYVPEKTLGCVSAAIAKARSVK